MVASQRKYKYGIIACHNGTVFKYTITGEVDYVNVDICFEKIYTAFYNGNTVNMKDAIKYLSKRGVDLEVL